MRYSLLFKRLFVLALVLGLVWVTYFVVFKLADEHLPLLFAILLAYCFLAYLGLPAMVRVWQYLHKSTRVPTRTHAADGWAVDPINIVVLARNEREFIRGMERSGWLRADDATVANKFRLTLAIVLNRPYPNAPFGTYYVFGRKQDLGFQIPIGRSPLNRHHVRFWRLGTTILQEEHEHLGFWRRLLKRFLPSGNQEIWVGAAVRDQGVNIRLRNLQIDHGIESDTTAERNFLVDTLKESGVLKDVINIKAGEPLHTRHQSFGETIIADGYVKLCQLKRQYET